VVISGRRSFATIGTGIFIWSESNLPAALSIYDLRLSLDVQPRPSLARNRQEAAIEDPPRDQFTYTQYYNRRCRTVGHLFQGRYKAILCDRDAYLWLDY
jgi:hypothetical protein